ncbi:MAG: acetylglutamate kinase [Bryobacterales bacterium]|nr:acetylglutamate kinase [Bryobacterales bacterium]
MAAERILVKLGGTLLDEPASRRRLAREIAELSATGARLTVVHGGGKQMTRYLAERGVESQFVNGLRVTTPEVVDALLKIFAGSVNHGLVASLVEAGALAVGLSGIDALLAEAEQMDPQLGAVGRVVKSNGGVLETLTAAGYLPVVACVAGDRAGNIYNVNADQMAVACAGGFQATRLVFLTDVEGVLDATKTLVPRLNKAACRELITSGVATGGMQAKLEAATSALDAGVGHVHIVGGATPGVLAAVVAGQHAGTVLEV